MSSEQDLLREGIERLGLISGQRRLEALERYLAELRLWNRKLGLVEAEGTELVVRHVLDCLAGIPLIRRELPESIADLGSGAGLPGIPIAIFNPEAAVTLVERSGRRCGFLRNAVAAVELSNVSVLEREVRRVSARYDMLVFRAFRPVDEPLCDVLRARLRPGGCVVAYKGRMEKLAPEAEVLGRSFQVEIVPVSVPFLDEERHLLVGRLA